MPTWGRRGGLFGHLGALLGLSKGLLGRSWDHLGGTLGRPGILEARNVENVNIFQACLENPWLRPLEARLGDPLGALLGRLGGFVDRLEAIFRPS